VFAIPNLRFVPEAILRTDPSGSSVGDQIHMIASGLASGRPQRRALRAVM
jgi:hypothetical protein